MLELASQSTRTLDDAGCDRAEGLAYYNEIDPFAAAWLRELINAGHIAPGHVDERDIRDVRPTDLAGYRQCHFFAGIGVWSYALRQAGWSDDRPVWTASCPCQPFSAAGQGRGIEDERHLWPVFEELRRAVRPVVAIGEQVASKDGLAWLDIVSADVEAAGDAFGAVDICAAGVGAPHIRQRLFWLAHADGEASRAGFRCGGSSELGIDAASCGCDTRGMADTLRGGAGDDAGEGLGAQAAADSLDRGVSRERLRPWIQGASDRLDNADNAGLEGFGRGYQAPFGWITSTGPAAAAGEPLRLEHASGIGRERGQAPASGHVDDGAAPERPEGQHGAGEPGAHRVPEHGPAATNGFWRAADWLFCRDGKWRPVGPGTFPLAHGAPARMGRLRGYGNAINAEVATAFIEAVIDTLEPSGAPTGHPASLGFLAGLSTQFTHSSEVSDA